MKFIRRNNRDNYIEDKEISITIAGETDTDNLEGIASTPDAAIEVELDDGSVVVLLGYLRQ